MHNINKKKVETKKDDKVYFIFIFILNYIAFIGLAHFPLILDKSFPMVGFSLISKYTAKTQYSIQNSTRNIKHGANTSFSNDMISINSKS